MVDLQTKLISWINAPENLTWEDVLMLENLEKEHPYFQTIKTLIAKHYLDNDHILKTKKINSASTYSLNRNSLRNFLNLKARPQNKKNTEAELKKETEAIIPQEHKKENSELKEESKTPEMIPETTEKVISEKFRNEPLEEKPQETAPLETNESNIVAEEIPISKVSSEREQERKELLSAINKRLDELKTKKESDLKQVKEELSKTKQKAEKKENHSIKPISFKKLIGNKTEQKKEPKTNQKKKKTSSKKKTSAKTKNKTPTQNEDTQAFKPQKIEPKDVFYSRLGNVLSSNTNDDIDNLLSYIQQKKESKTGKQKPESDIISKFIETEPRISKLDKTESGSQPDLSKQSQKVEHISESLAKINEKQGNIKTAISIYKKLILKFPEKKVYFANRIEKLKNK